MYDTGYYATGYHETGYYMRSGAVLDVVHTHDKFRQHDYNLQAIQEDEELIIIARAFIEIISCRH